VSASGEDGSVLQVGLDPEHPVRMDGRRLFPEAVRRMTEMLDRACTHAGLTREDLDLVVPHHANGRIIDAIQRRLGIPRDRVFDGIRFTGNTASTSIPLCLAELASKPGLMATVGLTAFGGGFTFGATVLELG
jgi:3-oxoacyl-[acyl-carrier-protein] synthase III